jgi:hypothetical protein
MKRYSIEPMFVIGDGVRRDEVFVASLGPEPEVK